MTVPFRISFDTDEWIEWIHKCIDGEAGHIPTSDQHNGHIYTFISSSAINLIPFFARWLNIVESLDCDGVMPAQ